MATKALAKRPQYPPGVQSAVDYAADVVAGTVDAGHLVHLACERFRRDLDEDTWEFRPELAERAMDFAGQMPNIKGIEAGRPLRLMPWQRLVFTNLFGFVEPGTNTRRFRQGVVFGLLGADGRLDPSHATLARLVARHVAMVQQQLDRLRQLGLLWWQLRLARAGWRAEQTSNAYRLSSAAAEIPGERCDPQIALV